MVKKENLNASVWLDSLLLRKPRSRALDSSSEMHGFSLLLTPYSKLAACVTSRKAPAGAVLHSLTSVSLMLDASVVSLASFLVLIDLR